MKNKPLLLILFLSISIISTAQTVTDVDGNTYNTVTIGTQVWMKENLKTTKYNNGTEIPNVTNKASWIALTTGAYCNYDNSSSYASIYGRLYNYYAVIDSNGLCPIGWHVPSEAEFKELKDYLVDSVGGKLKEAGYSHWDSVSYYHGATNESGFSAIGCGSRFYNGDFIGFNRWCNLWTATECSATDAVYYEIHENSDIFYGTCYEEDHDKNHGNTVRCIKDNSISTNATEAFEKNGEKVVSEIKIYPNPAHDILFIKISKELISNTQIFDFQGKSVNVKQVGENSFDISGLPKGMYFIKVAGTEYDQVSKLVKE